MSSDTTSLLDNFSQSYPPQQQQLNKMPSLEHVLASMEPAIHSGATQLPSRDFPSQQFPPSQLDPGVQQRYADTTLLDDGPSTQNKHVRYIEQEQEQGNYQDDNDQSYQEYNSFSSKSNMDSIYNALQMPLFLAVLYFLFQLPIMRQLQFQYMPFAFTQDANLNAFGMLLNGIGFAFIYYILQKIL